MTKPLISKGEFTVFALILREMNIHALLEITSTHCFLGYYRDEGRDSGVNYDLNS